MDPEKISSITNFKRPCDLKPLQSFLGLVTFSLCFLPNLAELTSPLRRLLQKGIPFKWTEECETCFTTLEEKVRKAPVLAHPDFSKPFKLQTDASNQGIGAVLLQQDDNQQWQPITFISRSLTKPEINYSTMEKEFLAIVWAFQRLHPYVHGTNV